MAVRDTLQPAVPRRSGHRLTADLGQKIGYLFALPELLEDPEEDDENEKPATAAGADVAH